MEKNQNRSKFVYSINQWAPHSQVSELFEVSAISTFNGSLKVTAYCLGPLTGWVLNTE